MIRIEKIRIRRFRGILDLTLELDEQNYAVCGPNGTGKSGVVDAIEFALSGDISRLSGKGRGDVSVKHHAPHVDFRDSPDEAVVELHGVLVATATKFNVVRSVAQAQAPTITPNVPEIVDTLEELGRHKNVTLSRRELIQYVLSTPGDRATEIQALLQLNGLRELRKNLQKIANSCKIEAKSAKQAREVAGTSLATALGIPKLTADAILAAVNIRRKLLELPEISALEANTSVKDGLTVASEKGASRLSKEVALADIQKLDEKLAAYTSASADKLTAAQIARLEPLANNKEFKQGIDKQALLTNALDLIEDGNCPVCDTVWKDEELVGHIKGKLQKLEGFIKEKEAVATELDQTIQVLNTLEASIRHVATHGGKTDPDADLTNLNTFAEALRQNAQTLKEFSSLDGVITCLKSLHVLPEKCREQLEQVTKLVDALPDTAKQDAARDFLVAVQERLDAFREARRLETSRAQEAELSQAVFKTYEKTHENGLNKIYSDIQDGFADLYRTVNRDDEGEFEAVLAAERAGLGLDVDFYGRGKFPPGAYHSEGHQDGMGLCLYLALMQHLYGENFQFCVLDDVLMSVDSGHRRAVCKLLDDKFPETQFIFTTHDEVWLKNMQTTGLIKPSHHVLFRNWTVEGGPAKWIAEDVWQEINDDVAKNDTRSAAARLRHYLEFLAGQLCHNLGASVLYRGDNRHSLGDLMPQATSRFAKLLKEAKSVAQSWNDEAERTRLTELEAAFKTSVGASSLEQWAINAQVHYNEWANLGKEDFEPVVAAFKKLIAHLECDKCHGLLYVTPEIGTKEALRCSCGKTNINLKKK